MDARPAAARRIEKTGVVVSDRMNKSRVVVVERLVRHPAYHKIMRRRARFMCHDEANVSRVGDRVLIRQTRPLSARKRWMLVEVLKKAAGRGAPAGEAP